MSEMELVSALKKSIGGDQRPLRALEASLWGRNDLNCLWDRVHVEFTFNPVFSTAGAVRDYRIDNPLYDRELTNDWNEDAQDATLNLLSTVEGTY